MFSRNHDKVQVLGFFFFLGNHNYGKTQEGNAGRGGFADGEKVNTVTRPKMMSPQFPTAVLYLWFHRSGRFHECGWAEGGGWTVATPQPHMRWLAGHPKARGWQRATPSGGVRHIWDG